MSAAEVSREFDMGSLKTRLVLSYLADEGKILRRRGMGSEWLYRPVFIGESLALLARRLLRQPGLAQLFDWIAVNPRRSGIEIQSAFPHESPRTIRHRLRILLGNDLLYAYPTSTPTKQYEVVQIDWVADLPITTNEAAQLLAVLQELAATLVDKYATVEKLVSAVLEAMDAVTLGTRNSKRVLALKEYTGYRGAQKQLAKAIDDDELRVSVIARPLENLGNLFSYGAALLKPSEGQAP